MVDTVNALFPPSTQRAKKLVAAAKAAKGTAWYYARAGHPASAKTLSCRAGSRPWNGDEHQAYAHSSMVKPLPLPFTIAVVTPTVQQVQIVDMIQIHNTGTLYMQVQ